MWSNSLLEDPLFVLVGALLAVWLAALAGRHLTARKRPSEPERDQIVLILNGTLTLAALLIGFSFAMAAGRYDQRKNYEEAEANAIGTEYARADLLPQPAASRVRALLVSYAQQRILFYEAPRERLPRIDRDTAKLQAELWSAVAQAAAAQPSPTMAVVVVGMNDVLNSQGYTQAAWWYRIPTAAWALMLAVSVACGALLGRVEPQVPPLTLLILPLILSTALFLIAEIDSPRNGWVRVAPQNLIALARSFGDETDQPNAVRQPGPQ